MANCKITQGIENSCDDRLRVGGLAPSFWVGYKSELDTQISLTQSADISTLDFGSYGGLRRFDGNKFSHSFTDNLQQGAGGRLISYLHSFIARVLSNTTTDDATLQDLNLGQDIFVICEDNNQNFFILGAGNGLSTASDDHGSGETGDADAADTITLTGSERTKALRFRLGAGYDATLTYLENLEL